MRALNTLLGEEQLGFRKGRGTTEGMFSLRHLVEKIIGEAMAHGFVFCGSRKSL